MFRSQIIEGLQHFQKYWSSEDYDCPFKGCVPDYLADVVTSNIGYFQSLMASRLILERAIPPSVLKRFQPREISSAEDINFEFRSSDDQSSINDHVALKMFLENSGYSERDLMIFVYYHAYGLTDSEIADKFGLSRQHVNQVRRKMERNLKDNKY